MTTRVADVRCARGVECPRCGRLIVRVEHTIGGEVRARPCGCRVRYRIDGDVVTVEVPQPRRDAA